MDDNTVIKELEMLFNEAWMNGFIDGYVSIVRKVPGYNEHQNDYEGRLLEEYESGYLSAIRDGGKWTRKYAYSKGYTDGYKTSKLGWKDFGFYAFWMPEYTGDLLKRYNAGYAKGFLACYCRQEDYEWSLGFVNQLRNPRNQLHGKNYHDNHGELYYPIAYEEGYNAAKSFCRFDSLDKAERAINLSLKRLWIIGFIDGMHNRNERFGYEFFHNNPAKEKSIFDEYSPEYHDGYKAGNFVCWNKDVEMAELESSSQNKDFIESFRKQKREEYVWGTGYIDGKLSGVLRYRGYGDSEYIIYKKGHEIGSAERISEQHNEKGTVSLYSAENIGMLDAMSYNQMTYQRYDRPRFLSYRKGFYKEKEWQFKKDVNWDEDKEHELLMFLKSFQVPQTQIYINNKLEAWKLGAISGFSCNTSETNKHIFLFNEYEYIFDQDENYCAHNIEAELYEAYEEGCKFGYEHTYRYKWDMAYDLGYSEAVQCASSETTENDYTKEKFQGFELEAYNKGFSDGIDESEKQSRSEDDYDDPAYEWTMRDSFDAMTDGMYGEYQGDVDFDKFGF